MAYEKGDWLLRAGWAEVAPNEGSSALKADGVPITGSDVIDVSSASALGISATYMFNSYLGLELLAATPFEHDISATGDLAGALTANSVSTDIGTTKQLPPTLTVQWYPVGNKSAWQPYLGAGINFTWFFDEQLDSGFADPQGLSDKDFTLSNSVGLAGIIGLDYVFSNNWVINASVMYAQIGTEAEITNSAFGDLKVDVDVDPWVYRLNIGYRFGGKSKAAPVVAAAVAAPVAAAVAAPVDSDGDGVNDDVDECPNTIQGAMINVQGCGIKQTGAHFKFDSDELNLDAETLLDEVAVRLRQYPDVKLLVEGHTDASGDEAYNVDLSQRRAQAAADYLVAEGVDASRLQVKGYGSAKPVADDTTREANRRVVFKTQ
jgi:outer membrane protein